ncbi:hypothetical protein HELRODRAFT_177723 [Helobdella robusta]|uniref:C-type lectin domain-containing protein n=1 Tax=Helobdella robusta TaxID=6412 RepID=T1FC48_HELRO|nr:hypothetical protein HELRODRAFT_177723 [Helobdella robusta]ESN97668.1 hypothetical protein HELRODRAFT_177723 [Helobdella robusta]
MLKKNVLYARSKKLEMNFKHYSYVWFCLLLLAIFPYTLQIQQFQLFKRAYSYLAGSHKTEVCFDETMDILIRIAACSIKKCILKCLDLTGMNLRGINYRTSVGSCLCVPKMNLLYNVTTDLTGGCLAYVTYDCPSEFDYIVENNRCYNYQVQQNTWIVSRDICNALLNSHLLIIDDSNEHHVLSSYLYNKNFLMVWTAGFRSYINRTSFFIWQPYPGKESPISYYSWWNDGANLVNLNMNCIVFVIEINRMENNYCGSSFSVLCEIDVIAEDLFTFEPDSCLSTARHLNHYTIVLPNTSQFGYNGLRHILLVNSEI